MLVERQKLGLECCCCHYWKHMHPTSQPRTAIMTCGCAGCWSCHSRRWMLWTGWPGMCRLQRCPKPTGDPQAMSACSSPVSLKGLERLTEEL